MGEILFLQLCKAADLNTAVRNLTEEDAGEVAKYIQGHAENKKEGVAGLLYTMLLAKRITAEMEKGEPQQTEDEALERAEGYDSAFANRKGLEK